MIAAVHPDYVLMRPSPIRSFATPLTATSTPAPRPEPPIEIGPPMQIASPVEIMPSQEPVVEPASASVAAPPTTDTSAPFSLSDWLTEETLFPGYPNGAVSAGAVIALAWIFGGKRRKR